MRVPPPLRHVVFSERNKYQLQYICVGARCSKRLRLEGNERRSVIPHRLSLSFTGSLEHRTRQDAGRQRRWHAWIGGIHIGHQEL